MTSILKNVFTGKFDDIGNKYNNTYHRTITIKDVNAKSSTFIDFNKENDKEGPNFKVGDHIRILKYILKYIVKTLYKKESKKKKKRTKRVQMEKGNTEKRE